jgi:hypothetical protein
MSQMTHHAKIMTEDVMLTTTYRPIFFVVGWIVSLHSQDQLLLAIHLIREQKKQINISIRPQL